MGKIHWGKASILVLIVMSILSCTDSTQSNRNVLLIAVEGLDYDRINCLDPDLDANGGFSQLCQESARFTHAYSTSNLTLPALASVFTAKYPYENLVFHNASSLSAKELTAAELAVKNKYRSSFFSSGSPVFRLSGLGQGFEVFDDHLDTINGEIFRPSSKLIEDFLNWEGRIQKQEQFFSALYLNDLLYPEIPSSTDSGVMRAATVSDQMQEIDESLSRLFKELKKQNRWNNTLIILFGTNGLEKWNRVSELPGTNLHTEVTQISLLIKNFSKPRDLGIQWKVDDNVSLVDVGRTLFEFLNQNTVVDDVWPKINLMTSLEAHESKIDNSRPVLIQTGWPTQVDESESFNIRSAFVKENHFVLWDQNPKVFNILVDRLQLVPLGPTEVSNLNLWGKLDRQLKVLSEPFSGIGRNVFEKYYQLHKDIEQKVEIEMNDLKNIIAAKDFEYLKKLKNTCRDNLTNLTKNSDCHDSASDALATWLFNINEPNANTFLDRYIRFSQLREMRRKIVLRRIKGGEFINTEDLLNVISSADEDFLKLKQNEKLKNTFTIRSQAQIK